MAAYYGKGIGAAVAAGRKSFAAKAAPTEAQTLARAL
jgi:hypothetical protein